MNKIYSKISVLFIALVYAFLYLPAFIMIIYSFNAGGFPDKWSGFSFNWYNDLFKSIEIWEAFKTSIIIALFSSILSVLMALALVYGESKKYNNLISFFYSNILVPDIIIAIGLLIMFSFMHIELGICTIITGHTLLGLGFSIPIIKMRFQELDNSLIEASMDLGASSTYTFFNIKLPFLFPAILVSFLLSVIVSFDDFLISFFCSGFSKQTLSVYIFSMIRSGIAPIVNALASLMLLFSFLCIFVIVIINRKLKIFRFL